MMDGLRFSFLRQSDFWRISILLFLLIAGSLFPLSSHSQFNPQTKSITEQFFPEPDFTISTPAFQKTSGFTNYTEMMDWLQKTIKPHTDLVNLSFIGESQKGKAIPQLVLTRKNSSPKIKVWMQGGLHGDEPAGTETMLHLIDQLLNNPEMNKWLEQLEIAIVPMANIDGYEKQQREAANGMDLNRDQTRLKAKESIALKSAFSAFQPAIALDFHEYRPYRKDFTRMGRAGITARYDAMFLYSGNLNVPQALRELTKNTFVARAEKILNEHQIINHDYITTQKYGSQVHFNLGSVHSRSSATNFALTNCVSMLLEIRGVGIGRTSFKRRIKSSYLIAQSVLETTLLERETLKKVLAEAEKSRHPVVVTSQKLVRKDSILVIDLASEKEIKMAVTLHDALQSKPTLQRERPNAYLISAKEKEAVFKLKILGIKVDSLATEKELTVETYTAGQQAEPENAENIVGDAEEDPEKTQASANTKSMAIKFPAGTYFINLDQPRANLACEVLEPENANGFVEMKVIKVNQNQELPVFRYLKSEKLKP